MHIKRISLITYRRYQLEALVVELFVKLVVDSMLSPNVWTAKRLEDSETAGNEYIVIDKMQKLL